MGRLMQAALAERLQAGWQWLKQRYPLADIPAHRARRKLLQPTERRLMNIGDLTLLALFVVAVSLVIERPELGSVSYVAKPRHDPELVQMPWLALGIGVWSFVVGWALLLTAATNMWKPGFYLMLLLAAGVILVVALWIGSWILVVPAGVALLAAVLLSLTKERRPILRNHQGVEFLIWSLALAVLVAGPLVRTDTRSKLPWALEAGFNLPVALLIPVLAVLAISGIWLVYDGSWALVEWVGARVRSDRTRALLIGLLGAIGSLSSMAVAISIRRDLWTTRIVWAFAGLQGLIATLAFLYVLAGHLVEKIRRFQVPIWLLAVIPAAALVKLWVTGSILVKLVLAVAITILVFLPAADKIREDFREMAAICVALLWLQVLALAAQGSLEEAVLVALRVPSIIVLALFLLAGLLQLGSWLAELHLQVPPRWWHRVLVALFLVPILAVIVLLMIGVRGQIILYLALLGVGGFMACYLYIPSDARKVPQSSRPTGALSTRILLWQGLTVLALASAVISFSSHGNSIIGDLQSFLLSEMALVLSMVIAGAWAFWRFRVQIQAHVLEEQQKQPRKRQRDAK
jgi:hypothetical protein